MTTIVVEMLNKSSKVVETKKAIQDQKGSFDLRQTIFEGTQDTPSDPYDGVKASNNIRRLRRLK